MSDQEKNEALGRLVTEHSRARQEQEILRAELYQAGLALYGIAERLKNYDIDGARSALERFGGPVKQDLEKLRQTFANFDDVSQRVRDYTAQLAAFGIKPIV